MLRTPRRENKPEAGHEGGERDRWSTPRRRSTEIPSVQLENVASACKKTDTKVQARNCAERRMLTSVERSSRHSACLSCERLFVPRSADRSKRETSQYGLHVRDCANETFDGDERCILTWCGRLVFVASLLAERAESTE